MPILDRQKKGMPVHKKLYRYIMTKVAGIDNFRDVSMIVISVRVGNEIPRVQSQDSQNSASPKQYDGSFPVVTTTSATD